MSKKSLKIIIAVLTIFSITITLKSMYAVNELGSGFDYGNVPRDNGEEILGTPIKKVWGTVLYVMQIASVAGVIIAGLRYMFASAEQRADLKKNMIFIVIGIVMVFAFSTFLQFILNAVAEL